MEKANLELRDTAKRENIPLWAIAQVLGISESTLIRWLRRPLEEHKREKFIKAVEDCRRSATPK